MEQVYTLVFPEVCVLWFCFVVQFKVQSVVTMKCHSARIQVKVSHQLCIELHVSRLLILTFFLGGGGEFRGFT